MGARAALQGVLLLLLSRALGSAQFGLFAASAALALGFGSLAPLGMGYLVLIRSGISMARGRMALASALPLTGLVGGGLLPIYMVTSKLILPDAIPWYACLAFGVAELLFAAPALVLAQRIQGDGRAGLAQSLYILPVALRLAWVALGVVGLGLSLFSYSICYLLTGGIALVVAWLIAVRLRLMPGRYSLPRASVVRISVPYAVTRLSAYGPGEIDKVLAPSVLRLMDAGSYSLVSRVIGFTMLPVNAMLAASQPRMALLQRSDFGAVRRLVNVLLAATFGYGLFIAAVLGFVGPVLLEFFAGKGYERVPECIRVLCWACLPMALRYTAGGMLLPLLRPLPRIVSEAVGLTLLCVMMPLLANNYGIVGAAWAVVLSESVMAAMLCTTLRITMRERC